jgi:hypothetical protein
MLAISDRSRYDEEVQSLTRAVLHYQGTHQGHRLGLSIIYESSNTAVAASGREWASALPLYFPVTETRWPFSAAACRLEEESTATACWSRMIRRTQSTREMLLLRGYRREADNAEAARRLCRELIDLCDRRGRLSQMGNWRGNFRTKCPPERSFSCPVTPMRSPNTACSSGVISSKSPLPERLSAKKDFGA